MITGKKEELDGAIKTHVCPEHLDKALTVTWQAKENAYIIACGGGHFPEEVTPKPTLTSELKQGALPEGPVKDRVLKGALRRRGGLAAPVDVQPLGLMPVTDFGDGHDITLAEVKRAVAYADRTGLDITLGHVCLYHGKPYPSIDGYLYHSRRTGIWYKLVTLPLNKAEREQYQVGELDYAWMCKIFMCASGAEFSGIGIVTDAERTEMSTKDSTKHRNPVLVAKPWQMAQKRAEWQALRRAFPLGMENENGNDK